MRTGVTATVAVLCSATIGLGAAPSALGKTKPCRRGTVAAKINGRAACLSRRLVLPAPAKVAPGIAQLQGAMSLLQIGLNTRSGKHVAPLSRRVGKSWATVRSRVQKAMSATFTRLARSVPQHNAAVMADAACSIMDVIAQGGTINVGDGPVQLSGTTTVDGVTVSLGSTSTGGMKVGMESTVDGTTYKMSYEAGEVQCMKAALPRCPEADGSLDSFGIKGKSGFSMTVTRGGKVLSKRSYSQTVTIETKGKVADDAKLDYVDVRYGETTVTNSDGLRYTSYGTRLAHIDFRRGEITKDSVSFGSGSQAGDIANTTGIEANERDFAAFISKTIGEYGQRETKWQTPNTCAKLSFDPKSGSKTLNAGDHGTFNAEAQTNKGSETASAARWTLSAQTSGTFSPTSSRDRRPSFSYDVSGNPSGDTVNVTVKATSTAGVAQEVWSQKLKVLKTISGTFTGHATDLGVVYDWTGTATFTRSQGGAGGGGTFQLTSGQATVTVSGSLNGSGCDQTGTASIGLVQGSSWTVTGTKAPYSYSIIAPFQSTSLSATNENCTPESGKSDGSSESLGSMPSPALQSGDLTSLFKTTTDLFHYTGSATATLFLDPGQTESWTWSMTGSS